MPDPVFNDPMSVLVILLSLLAVLFFANTTDAGKKLFNYVPLLVFAYFLPTALSNTRLIPMTEDFALYEFVKQWLLPASLALLILAVDLPAIMKLGRNAGLLFLAGTATIILGGPLAVLIFGWALPSGLGEQSWKGLAALSGSWIGGGANFVAVGQQVGASSGTLSLMVVVDVVVANTWMACLLYFAGREKQMDEGIGADRTTLDECRRKVEEYHDSVVGTTKHSDLLAILALGFGTTAVAKFLTPYMPTFGGFLGGFTWTIMLVAAMGFAYSFTPLRRLDGVGASAMGSTFLYLLVTTIGAKADFMKVVDPDNLGLLLVAAVWMIFHAVLLLLVRRLLKAPIFFAAVGSQANVGGAASAPIVAAAFHPSLAPVGVLLAVAGYFVGVYGGIVCAFLLKLAYGVWH